MSTVRTLADSDCPALSILIPSLACRVAVLDRLLTGLMPQVGDRVEVLLAGDTGELTIGAKRNMLVKAARGEYLCGVDDDDTVSDDYVSSILGVLGRADVVTFDVDWQAGEPFLDWHAPSTIGFRPLAVVRSGIAKRFTFPDWWQSEDRAYATWLQAQQPSVIHIPRVLYRYHFRAAKPEYGGQMYRPEGHMATREEVARVVAGQ